MLNPRCRIAAALMIVSLVLCAPGMAFADDDQTNHGRHGEKHGPMPIAALGSVFGGALWLVSTPFCVLFAPKHIMDSFDLLVAAPWRMAVGSQD